jgi:hypothetical protein
VGGTCGTHGGGERCLLERPEGKKPLVRPRRRLEDNINLNLMEIRIDVANWIRLAQHKDRWWDFVNTVMNLVI